MAGFPALAGFAEWRGSQQISYRYHTVGFAGGARTRNGIKGKSILTIGEDVHDIYEVAVACSNHRCAAVGMYRVSFVLSGAHFEQMLACVMLTER
jgi:hypothetical protein